ncbi:MAG: inorganic phosphate transporter [Halobacteriales archaeon]
MESVLLAGGVVVAAFVGFNIGGSSTGVAFGPAVGSGVVSKLAAGALMAAFAMLGGWTVGRNVVRTLGGELVPSSLFSMWVSIVVLFFIGLALLVSNLFGVPASTSMTAVGAIAGLGIATGSLDWAWMGRIVSWWLVAPVLAFWVSGVIGRYAYPRLVATFAVASTEGPLLSVDRSGTVPRVGLGPGSTRREVLGTALVVVIGCYMAFSAGASNVANAVAPLVGNDALSMTWGLLLGGGAIGLGALTIGRRTLDTVGNDLTELPILAALVVELVSASLITALSWLGIPASFVVVATMSILGLGWGRATRTVTASDAVAGSAEGGVSVGALAAESEEEGVPTVGDPNPDGEATSAASQAAGEGPVPEMGEEVPEDLPDAEDLFDPSTTARVLLLQNVVPAIAAVAAYLLFRLVPPV